MKRHDHPWRWSSVMGSMLLAATTAATSAQAATDLAWALQKTLDGNPALAAYPYQVRRSEALVLQAGVRPLPSLEVTAENVAGNGLYSGNDLAEYTLSLSQLVELGDKRRHRIAAADASMAGEQAEYELTRLDTLAETGRRYLQVLRLQALGAWMDSRAASEGDALAAIRERADAGAAGPADVSKMALRQAESTALATQLRLAGDLARTRLAAMWLGQADFPSVTGDLAALPQLPAQAGLLAALENSPRIFRQTALARLGDARVALAQANGRSDLLLGFGLRHFEFSGDQALVLQAKLPLAFSNPNRGRIEAAREQQALSWQETEWRRRELELALLEIHQSLASGLAMERQLREQLLPLARNQLNETRRGYRLGRYDVLQWVDAQRELYALQAQLIEARTSVHLNLIELERITGQALAVDRGTTP